MPAIFRQQLRLLYYIARGHGPLLRTRLNGGDTGAWEQCLKSVRSVFNQKSPSLFPGESNRAHTPVRAAARHNPLSHPQPET